jgi:hypothetical protein
MSDFFFQSSPLGATAFPNARFGRGTGPIAFNNIACTGAELSLFDCANDGYANIGSCTHADDASVSCQEGIFSHELAHIITA